MNNVEIYDIEVYYNYFCYTGLNRDTEELYQYELHNDNKSLEGIRYHLKTLQGMVGYNNNSYDYPILYEIMKNKAITNEGIFNKSQNIITQERIWLKKWQILIPQLDLFKIWHFDNKNRGTGLKDLECAMNWHNVQDLPIKYNSIISEEQAKQILKYNLNDVLATYEFYKLSIDKIELRKKLRLQYGIDCLNWSDSKIGEELMLKLYCEATNSDYWHTKSLRTNRKQIDLAECIFQDKIEFKSKEFNNLLNILMK